MAFHSIGIAAFNRFDYLWKTVESCLASSDADFELLVLDDASTEVDAEDFYERLKGIDSRISVKRGVSNKGVGSRFAELQKEASGELVHMLGSDDLCHPKRLERTRDYLVGRKCYRDVFCSSAKQLDAKYGMLKGPSKVYSGVEIKASLFFSPIVLHPTVTTWNAELSGLRPYREGMRAAVDYCYYVENFMDSVFVSVPDCLTYLVHSSSGITRGKLSRCNQLAMHDYVMHRLWSKFADCRLEDISALRLLMVTDECPQIYMQSYGNERIQGLAELVDCVLSCVMEECQEAGRGRFGRFLASTKEAEEMGMVVNGLFNMALKRMGSLMQ